ncbi:MAG: metallophosphoesterase [Eubacteriales bacterium]
MSLFVIADTHLSLSVKKPMDIFGDRWNGYTEKLISRWRTTVRDGDTVVLPGDISWAMELEEARDDLMLLDSLPGRKIIGRGNHDYWWSSAKKLAEFTAENNITTLDFLYNNAFIAENTVICGTRGWYTDEKIASRGADYRKLIAREAARLTLSLEQGVKLDAGAGRERAAFLHFPPAFGDYICPELIEVLHKYGVASCFYGHIHGQYDIGQVREIDGIEFVLCAADYLDFYPMRII